MYINTALTSVRVKRECHPQRDFVMMQRHILRTKIIINVWIFVGKVNVFIWELKHNLEFYKIT